MSFESSFVQDWGVERQMGLGLVKSDVGRAGRVSGPRLCSAAPPRRSLGMPSVLNASAPTYTTQHTSPDNLLTDQHVRHKYHKAGCCAVSDYEAPVDANCSGHQAGRSTTTCAIFE
jgi:hypothetical protein